MVGNTPTASSPSFQLGSRWQDVLEYSIPLAVFGAVLSCVPLIVSIGGNILLLVVILKSPQLRNVPFNLLLASLAVSDLLIGLLVQSLHGAMSVCVLISVKCSSLLDIHHRVLSYLGTFLAISSCLNIAIMTIERYILVVESLQYHSVVTKTRVIQAIFTGWMISAVFPSTRLFPSFPVIAIRVFQIVVICSILVVLIFCYMKIYCVSRRFKRPKTPQLHEVAQEPRKQDFRSLNTVFLVVAAVFISYTPLLIVQFLLNFSRLIYQVKIFHPFAVTVFLISSSVNPLILFFRSRKLRRYLKRLLKKGR